MTESLQIKDYSAAGIAHLAAEAAAAFVPEERVPGRASLPIKNKEQEIFVDCLE
ncbi:MAG: hypothetical protein H7Z43_03095 [Clostridia bacterium]|nr:hypothetical protein [Deltaproteobacteria bacterium]